MPQSVITGTIQTIVAGTSARSFTVESYNDPHFDSAGLTTVNTQITVTCASNGSFSVSLHGMADYRVVVSDAWKRTVWLIHVPGDGAPYTIDQVHVTSAPADDNTYYTAAAIDALLAGLGGGGGTVTVRTGAADPIDPPLSTDILYLNYTLGRLFGNDHLGHWKVLVG